MKLLIDAIERVHACRTHDELVYLFEQHGAAWRRQLSGPDLRTLVRHARERGRILESIESIEGDSALPMGGQNGWKSRL